MSAKKKEKQQEKVHPLLKKIVYVEWVDSVSYFGWHEDEQAEKWMAEDDEMLCRSSGFLIRDEKDYIAIMQSKSKGSHGDIMKIPRAAIIKIRRMV